MIGLPPLGYEEHHLKMHHGENNFYPGDLSSTECFERDNLFHWFIYWARYAFFIYIELPLWCLWKGHTKEGFKITAALLSFYTFVAVGYKYNANATFWCFIFPNIFATFAFMFGNFSQHCFVNPKNCRSSYGLAYNIINAKVNLGFWNDGYHLQHHANSRTLWRDLPTAFLKSQDKIVAKGGLTFQNCVYQQLFFYGFTGQYEKIYDYYVPLAPEQDMTREEFVEFIQEWYRPIFEKGHENSLFARFLRATARREAAIITLKCTEAKQ